MRRGGRGMYNVEGGWGGGNRGIGRNGEGDNGKGEMGRGDLERKCGKVQVTTKDRRSKFESQFRVILLPKDLLSTSNLQPLSSSIL